MGKKRIVVDTNNFVSAFGWKGNSREILRMVIDGECRLFTSTKQLDEVKKVLGYPKFGFSNSQKEAFLTLIHEIATITKPKEPVEATKDPYDNAIIECAIEANADCIISGDKHLLGLKDFRGVKIINAKGFMRLCQ